MNEPQAPSKEAVAAIARIKPDGISKTGQLPWGDTELARLLDHISNLPIFMTRTLKDVERLEVDQADAVSAESGRVMFRVSLTVAGTLIETTTPVQVYDPNPMRAAWKGVT